MSKDKKSAQFLAGLTRLIDAGASIKARRNVLLARLPPDGAGLRFIKEMRAIGGWEWEVADRVFISYYPGG